VSGPQWVMLRRAGEWMDELQMYESTLPCKRLLCPNELYTERGNLPLPGYPNSHAQYQVIQRKSSPLSSHPSLAAVVKPAIAFPHTHPRCLSADRRVAVNGCGRISQEHDHWAWYGGPLHGGGGLHLCCGQLVRSLEAPHDPARCVSCPVRCLRIVVS